MEWESLTLRQRGSSWFQTHQVAGDVQLYGEPNGCNGVGIQKHSSWHIAPKELLPVLLACIVWGKEWSEKLITCHCDNMAVVEVLKSGYSRDREMMHLLRCLFFITEHFHIQVEAVHLPGKKRMDGPMHYPAALFSFFCRHPRVQPKHQLTSPAKHWHCWWKNSQTGHHRAGQNCFSALQARTCSIHTADICVREETLSQLLRETRCASTTSHRGPSSAIS